MSLRDFTKEELKEKFELFLFSTDDYIEVLLEKTEKQGYDLNFSLRSLNDLEKYLIQNKIDANDDDIDGAAAYFGEVVRKNIGGIWKCSLELENSLFYGKPVITEYTNPKDLEFSPFDYILNYIANPKPNFFIAIIKDDLDDDCCLNLDNIPTE